MKKKYNVIWADTAEADLDAIIEYITQDSLDNALNIFHRFKGKADRLDRFPNKGRIVPELKDEGIYQYREIIIPPWRLIYRIDKKTVFVLSVIDSRQNVEDILLERFINR